MTMELFIIIGLIGCILDGSLIRMGGRGGKKL